MTLSNSKKNEAQCYTQFRLFITEVAPSGYRDCFGSLPNDAEVISNYIN